jgi:hypothetical protein
MNKLNKKIAKEKTLMIQVSNGLPKSEALGFAKTMRTPDKFFIYKVDENPDARDRQRREYWAVVRSPREGEIVRGCYAIWVDREKISEPT